jgi:mannonate dehydratase
MEKTWRWFGKTDRITLDMLRQIGVEGIVTALHHIPNGEVWPLEAVNDLKTHIESNGLRWSVVESLPVSEAIKYGGPERDLLIENYKESLKNLGTAGVKTVCYNFMPVIDWIRTDLFYKLPDGTYSLYFDKIKFAYFDIHILKRAGAEKDYTAEELEKVEKFKQKATTDDDNLLIENIIVKTQGFVNGNFKEGDKNVVGLFNELLDKYRNIDKEKLRANCRYFLEAVIPTARQYGVSLCVHPDDPPFAVLGLPRIVTGDDDIEWILNAVDDIHNGLTFCVGSLSAGKHNNVVQLAKKYASRSHFVHLRITEVENNGNFTEASHLESSGRLIDIIRIFEKENPSLPMRVDHGRLMLDDMDKKYNPGYSFLGRAFALAQVSGIMATVNHHNHSMK